jgi:hypothetical protein
MVGDVELLPWRGRISAGDDGGFGGRRGACCDAFFDIIKASVAATRRERRIETREEGGDTRSSCLPMKFGGGLSRISGERFLPDGGVSGSSSRGRRERGV